MTDWEKQFTDLQAEIAAQRILVGTVLSEMALGQGDPRAWLFEAVESSIGATNFSIPNANEQDRYLLSRIETIIRKIMEKAEVRLDRRMKEQDR